MILYSINDDQDFESHPFKSCYVPCSLPIGEIIAKVFESQKLGSNNIKEWAEVLECQVFDRNHKPITKTFWTNTYGIDHADPIEIKFRTKPKKRGWKYRMYKFLNSNEKTTTWVWDWQSMESSNIIKDKNKQD